jgi:hypothetical protein
MCVHAYGMQRKGAFSRWIVHMHLPCRVLINNVYIYTCSSPSSTGAELRAPGSPLCHVSLRSILLKEESVYSKPLAQWESTYSAIFWFKPH